MRPILQYNDNTVCHTMLTKSGCRSIVDTKCITYSGATLSCIGVGTNDRLNIILEKINSTICSIGGGSTLTFDNGLTRTLDNVQLGGPLTQDTTLTLNTFQVNFDGAGFHDYSYIDDGDIRFSVGDNTNHAFTQISQLANGASFQALIDGSDIQGEIDGVLDTLAGTGKWHIYLEKTGIFYSELHLFETGLHLKAGTSHLTAKGIDIDLLGDITFDNYPNTRNDGTTDKALAISNASGDVVYSTISITSSGVSDFTEAAQDAVGGMIDSTLTYVDGTPLLQVTPNTTVQKVEVVKNSGAVVGTRKQLNFIEGTNITLTITDDGGNDQVDILIAASGGGLGTDELLKVSGNDTTAGYLNGKLVAGTGITLTENNDGGNETLTVATTITQYTDELAQDAVGNILVDSSTVDFTYNDGLNTITADVINDSITYAKIQNVSANVVLGRVSTSGDIQELTLGSGLGFSGTTIVNTAPSTPPPINTLLSSTGSNSISVSDDTQEWDWNQLDTSAIGMSFKSTSTIIGAIGNVDLVKIGFAGKKITNNGSLTALSVENTSFQNLVSSQNVGIRVTMNPADLTDDSTGIIVNSNGVNNLLSNIGGDISAYDSETNIALRLSATGGTDNFALIVPASSGFSGFGISAPTTTVHISGASGLRYTDGNEAAGRVLTSDANGVASWVDPAVSADTNFFNTNLSAAANRTHTSGAFTQEITYNSLAGASGFKLSSTSTAAASNLQRLVEVNLSGANATSSQTTVAGYFSNSHTGTTPINYGVYAIATGASNSRAGVFEGDSGNSTFTLRATTGARSLDIGLGANDVALFQNSHTTAQAGFDFQTRTAVKLFQIGTADIRTPNIPNATVDTDRFLVWDTADSNKIKYRTGAELLSDIGAASLSFTTIAVSGQSNVVADSASDTLTLVAGTNMTITTDAGTDTITVSTGGRNAQSGTTYTVQATDQSKIVGLSNTGVRTVTLCAANAVVAGSIIWFKDEAGNAATNNITINRAGSDTIDGGTSVVLNVNYSAIGLYSDGVSAWFTI